MPQAHLTLYKQYTYFSYLKHETAEGLCIQDISEVVEPQREDWKRKIIVLKGQEIFHKIDIATVRFNIYYTSFLFIFVIEILHV